VGCDLVQIAAGLRHKNPDMSWLYTSASEKSQVAGVESLANLLEGAKKDVSSVDKQLL